MARLQDLSSYIVIILVLVVAPPRAARGHAPILEALTSSARKKAIYPFECHPLVCMGKS